MNERRERERGRERNKKEREGEKDINRLRPIHVLNFCSTVQCYPLIYPKLYKV
jgi:hypothetical protein